MADAALKFKFDAVYYHVNDIEKSIPFYRDVLGMKLVSRDYVARFQLDGLLFELVPSPEQTVTAAAGNARLSLGVADIEQATHELQAKGVETTPVRQEPGGYLSLFHDPDGNELCLWQYAS